MDTCLSAGTWSRASNEERKKCVCRTETLPRTVVTQAFVAGPESWLAEAMRYPIHKAVWGDRLSVAGEFDQALSILLKCSCQLKVVQILLQTEPLAVHTVLAADGQGATTMDGPGTASPLRSQHRTFWKDPRKNVAN